MKKLLYLLLLTSSMLNYSCTMMVKGLSKSIAKHYDEHTDMNVSNLVLADKDGKEQTFSSLFAGKTVYMYVWKHNELLPLSDSDSSYTALKRRFLKYNDVVFINLYDGNVPEDWQKALALKNKGVRSYQLSASPANDDFKNLMGPSTSPQIIGKDGAILSFQGPKPKDKILVDYVLYQAREGQNGTKSAKQMIKGINSDLHFKDQKLTDWYEKHYGKKPEGKLAVGISSANSNVNF